MPQLLWRAEAVLERAERVNLATAPDADLLRIVEVLFLELTALARALGQQWPISARMITRMAGLTSGAEQGSDRKADANSPLAEPSSGAELVARVEELRSDLGEAIRIARRVQVTD